MADLAERIATAFRDACLDELEAPKPGNVHAASAGHRMTAADFVRSAAVAAPALAFPGARVGARILGAVDATLAAVGTNTNLGIVLLCAPLAAAAEARPADLRAALAQVLAGLDVADAELAFRAIRKASPGGLGRAARHDVFAPASVSLREAMAAASDRDLIARQYAIGFEDVFDFGEPLLTASLARCRDRRLAALATYLGFLSSFPDTHIVRKHGIDVAADVCAAALTFHKRLQAGEGAQPALTDIAAWDVWLKDKGINPGTSADLTVATLFVHRLRNVLPRPDKSD